ncbi:hypothetical protein VPH35_072686 [Triticum aestivum]
MPCIEEELMYFQIEEEHRCFSTWWPLPSIPSIASAAAAEVRDRCQAEPLAIHSSGGHDGLDAAGVTP